MKINRAEGIFSIIMLAISAISAMVVFKMINSLKNLMNKMLLLFVFSITIINTLALSSPIKVVEKEIFKSTFVKEKSEKESSSILNNTNNNIFINREVIEEKDIKGIKINILDIEKNKRRLLKYIYKNNFQKGSNNIFIKGTKVYGSEKQYLLPISLVKYSKADNSKFILIKKDNNEYSFFSNNKKYVNEDSNIILPLNVVEFQGGIY